MATVIVNNTKKEVPRPTIREGCAVHVVGLGTDDWYHVVNIAGVFYLTAIDCGRYFSSQGVLCSDDTNTSNNLYAVVEGSGRYTVAAVAQPDQITVTINLKES